MEKNRQMGVPYRRKDYVECCQKLRSDIEMEYKLFKLRVLSGNNKSIYRQCRKIVFYETMHEYFQYCEELNREFIDSCCMDSMLLAKLWDLYRKKQYVHIDTWAEIEKFLNVYLGSKKASEQ